MRPFFKICLVFGIIFCFIETQAQKQNLIFEKITDNHARSLGTITGITQDKYGFMWIATTSGLYKFDGYSTEVYRNKPNDSLSIPFDKITYMHQDKSRNLWLRSFGELFAFKHEKRNFSYPFITGKDYDSDVKIVEDDFNNYWVESSNIGLWRFNKSTGTKTVYKKFEPQYPPQMFQSYETIKDTQSALSSLLNIGSNRDTTLRFELDKKTGILLVSTGEKDNYGVCDFGYIISGNDTVWKMDFSKAKHAGGSPQNKIQFEMITLEAGKYQLGFKTDALNASGNWKIKKPDKVDFYGIAVYKIKANSKAKINAMIKQKYIPENSLLSDEIVDMYVNREGKVCLLSEQGIDIYDDVSHEFIHHSFDLSRHFRFIPKLTVLYQDSDGQYWIGSNNGLIKYSPEPYSLEVFSNNNENDSLLSGNEIYSICQSRNGKIWFGTNKGLTVYDKNLDEFHCYTANVRNNLYDNRITQIFCDRSGNVWLGTFNGLNKLVKSRFKFYDLRIRRYYKFAYCFDKEGKIWYRGRDNNLMAYNRFNNVSQTYPIDKALFPKHINSDERIFLFNDILFDNQNRLWIAIDKKLCRFDKKRKKVSEVLSIKDYQYDDEEMVNQISVLFEDSENRLWIFANDAAYRLDEQNEAISDTIPFDLLIDKSSIQDFNFVKYVTQDNKGIIWLRTSQGVYTIEPQQKILYDKILFEEAVHNTALAEGNIAFDHNGAAWVAVLPTLYRIPRKGDKETFYAQGCGDVGNGNVKITQDSTVWIYTDNGLFSFNWYKKEFKTFTIRDGLVNNTINGLVSGRNRNFWLATPRGLSKFVCDNHTFINYFKTTDNIHYEFVDATEKFKKNTGELLFVSNNGLLSYYPDSINQIPPLTVITKFALSGSINITLDSLIYQKQQINLDYNQNSFEIEFAALDYTANDENEYAYILEGFENEWTYCSAFDRKAKYTNLDPGEYVFKIKASNNDKIWSEPRRLTIIIKPPFWKTPWFIAIEVLLSILAIYFIIKIRERKLIRDKRRLEKIVAERTAEIAEQNKKIQQQRDLARKQRDQIAEQKKGIMDSIQYASRIQNAVFPREELIKKYLNDYFILNKPRDIVSGDFYWLSQKQNKIVAVVADCTGHGVPGAFMSLLGISFLNEIVNKNLPEHNTDFSAAELLEKLRAKVIDSLHQTGKDSDTKDGMDMALCIIEKDKMKLQFSGAYNPLYILRKMPAGNQTDAGGYDLIQIKADRMPIGFYYKQIKEFTNHSVELQKGDMLYMFSDGYIDQFGGNQGKKFMTKRFKKLLVEIADKSPKEQKIILNVQHEQWKTTASKSGKVYEQIDDILVMGIRI